MNGGSPERNDKETQDCDSREKLDSGHRLGRIFTSLHDSKAIIGSQFTAKRENLDERGEYRVERI